MKAMILAAGKGERMQPLTLDTPKPLLCVNGKPMIVWHILNLAAVGIKEIVINVCYLADKIIEQLGDGSDFGVKLIYSDERQYPQNLDTGGGVLNARHLLGADPFILVSADIVTDFPFEVFLASDINPTAAHLVLVDNPPFHPIGDFGLKDGIVNENASKKMNFAGISFVSPFVLRAESPYPVGLADLLSPYIKKGEVTGSYYQGSWQNIGTPEQLIALTG